jgi:hypothetical protein
MKIVLPLFGVGAFLLFSPGCGQSTPALDSHMLATSNQQRAFDSSAVETLQDALLKSAVLEQHAIYPYHFVPQSAVLTELGQRDLDILAEKYKELPGPLVLVRGDATDELYAQRRATIVDAFKAAAVPGDRITVVEGLPGGTGVSSQYVVDTANDKKKGYAGSTDSGSMTNTGITAPEKFEGER